MLVIDEGIAKAVEQSEIDYMTDRMLAMQEREGNPMCIDLRSFGNARAFYSREMPWPQFNTVKGMSMQDKALIDEAIQFYKERGGRVQFEITPLAADRALLQALSAKGLYQSGFHASLVGVPHEAAPSPEGVTVRQLQQDEFDLYAEIHCLGTGLPIEGKGYVAANNQILFERKGWRFFIGFLDEQPAGVGVMFMQDGLASLTFAATLPQFRHRGIHRALIERRIQEAQHTCCRLVVSQATYASGSFRNMERSGMKLAYTRATWSERE